MTFLSYIRGPLVNNWVQEQAQWLVDQLTTGVLQTKENLWQTLIQDLGKHTWTLLKA